jgi:hypothetical protein
VAWSWRRRRQQLKNEEPKDYLTCRRNGETVAGVKLDNNTASKKKLNKYDNSRRNGETVAGVKLDNNTGGTTQSEQWY